MGVRLCGDTLRWCGAIIRGHAQPARRMHDLTLAYLAGGWIGLLLLLGVLPKQLAQLMVAGCWVALLGVFVWSVVALF